MTRSNPTATATVADVQRLCQRARSAGSPNAAARGRLVNEYRALAAALDVEPEPVETGRELQHAAVELLRAAAAAEAAAAATPVGRLRALGLRTG
jgi:hypothetical protein